MDNYADLMFSEAVQSFQERVGMRDKYQEIYAGRHRDDLDEKTIVFISASSSFYIASQGANGWPYVQHRGGPAGFVKILGPDTIGFADYLGNRQFITRGNLETSKRVSLFFMDYARRARLKMQGIATMIDAESDPELQAKLATSEEGPVERLTTIKIIARDWNCPKYIEPRYTEDQIHQMLEPKISALVAENEQLKAQLTALKSP